MVLNILNLEKPVNMYQEKTGDDAELKPIISEW